MTEFGVIESMEQLDEAILFISDGYNWDESRAGLIRRGILSCNGSDHAYGGWLKDDEDQVVNAILFFYQGEIRSGGTIRTVIGTSSWYADEAHRGLESIRFLNKVTDYLKSHYAIITNYTPNVVATDLYQRLGFKPQSVIQIKLFCWNLIRFIGKRQLRVPLEEDRAEYIRGFAYLGSLSKITLNIRGVTMVVVIRVCRVERFHIPMRIVEVLWTDSYQALTENIATAGLMLCARTKAVAMHLYLKSAVYDKSCTWLVFDPEAAVSFVSPVQSELTCI